jgi:DNA-binding NarL/FixJ family response regulator
MVSALDRSRPEDSVSIHPDDIRVAVVDDHPVVLSGIRAWIEQADPSIDVVCAVPSWSELLFHPGFPVDVVLLDLDLADGIPAPVKIATLRAARVAVVMISAFGESRNVTECLSAGALAFVPKTECADHLLDAVVKAAAGEPYLVPMAAAALVPGGAGEAEQVADPDDVRSVLSPALSPQERRALILYASGLPMKSVARRLDISFETAKCYVDRVREKYERAGREARTKIELRQRAVEDGLLPDTLPG